RLDWWRWGGVTRRNDDTRRRADELPALANLIGADLEFFGPDRNQGPEVIVQHAHVAERVQDRVRAEEVDDRILVPRRRQLGRNVERLVAVLDEAETVFAVVDERLFDRRGTDGLPVLVDDGPRRR